VITRRCCSNIPNTNLIPRRWKSLWLTIRTGTLLLLHLPNRITDKAAELFRGGFQDFVNPFEVATSIIKSSYSDKTLTVHGKMYSFHHIWHYYSMSKLSTKSYVYIYDCNKQFSSDSLDACTYKLRSLQCFLGIRYSPKTFLRLGSFINRTGVGGCFTTWCNVKFVVTLHVRVFYVVR